MKVCHISDSHLGAGENHRRRAVSGLTERQEDIIRAYIAAVDKIIEIKPDICLHAGDLFHKVRPLNSIMAVAADQFSRLADQAGIPTVVIAGNHDAPKQPHVGAALDVYRTIPNLYIAASGRMERFRIGPMAVHALPHCLSPTELQRQIEKWQPDDKADLNVLVAHGVAAGMPEFSMADLGEQEIPIAFLNRFDYAALGHFHNFSKVARQAWYAGSTERLSQSERESDKGFAVVTFAPLRVELVPVGARAMIDLPPLNASGCRGDQIAVELTKQLERIDARDKIIRVTVENVSAEMLKTLPAEAIADLREKVFDLDIRYSKAAPDEPTEKFGRSAIGRLDQGFLEFLETADLEGFDRERLKRAALKYLQAEK